MKKITLLIISCCAFLFSKAQVTVDTVSVDSAYANQVWYSLAYGIQGTAPQNNWDIAFDIGSMGYAIAINSVNGIEVWKYPKADTGGWNNVDTSGLTTWAPRWNSLYYWQLGAIGNNPGSSTQGDVDWGIYDINTHKVIGDSLFIIKLANGSYKKLWIESLIGTIYRFRYADLDGSNLQTATLDKINFNDKNFGYYSLQNNTSLDREPPSPNWDLVFTTYTALSPIPHTEAAVLSNENTLVAVCTGIADVNTYTDYSNSSFSDSIGTIGHEWKTGSGSNYVVKDSLLYFVQNENGDIWKLVFKGFGGIANGDYIFSKQPLTTTTSVQNGPKYSTASMALYPNPSSGGRCQVVYNLNTGQSHSAMLTVTDLSGKCVYTDKIMVTNGLQQYVLPLANVLPGMYIVTIETENGIVVQQKLVYNR